jgi:putative transcriptional regulator
MTFIRRKKQMTLKEIRLKNEMSQEQLAEKLNINRSTIAMIETGKNQLTVQLAKQIAEILGCNWTEMFED